MKPCKYWDIYHINWCRISSINSIINQPAGLSFFRGRDGDEATFRGLASGSAVYSGGRDEMPKQTDADSDG